jgi:hypothetical protein
MRWQLAAVTALLPAAGCSFLVSTSGLASGDRTSADAATDGSDDGLDAGMDATKDGPGDAPAAPDSAARFCGAAGTAFCDDFDRNGAPKDGWSEQEVSLGSSLAFSTVRAVSGPTSLLAMNPARPASATDATYAVLGRDLAVTAARMVVVFDVYVVRPAFQTTDVNMGIACLGLRTAGVRDHLCISVGADYVGFAGTNGTALTFDAWVHVEATVDHSGTPIATVKIGKDVYTGLPDRTNETTRPDLVFLDLGLHGYNEPAPAFTVFYDNVTIDWR